MLGIAILNVLLTNVLAPSPPGSLVAIFSIILLGGMGWRLPFNAQPIYKVFYTFVEFAVMLLPSVIDQQIPVVPILGVIVIIRSCQLFQRTGRVVVVVLALLVLLQSPFFRSQPMLPTGFSLGQAAVLTEQLSCSSSLLQAFSIASLVLVIACILLLFSTLIADQKSRKQLATAHQELAIAHEQLRQYALQIEDQAALQERNRIAREIHDSIGHALTAQSIQLENALLFLQSDLDRARAFLVEARALGSQALKDVRHSVATLRSDPLHGKPVNDAVIGLLTDFASTTQITPNYLIQLAHTLTPEVSIALYRLVQEALTNIAKHAAATQVTIHIETTDSRLHLWIQDNGKGFNLAQNTTGFGLQGMRERITALGGHLHLTTQPGKGCMITAWIPLARRSP